MGSLKKGAEDIQKTITELVVYSNGSFSWTEAWNMSFSEREMAIKVLNDYNKIKAGKSPSDWL